MNNGDIIQIPIVVQMDVLENSNVYELAVDKTVNEFTLTLDTAVIAEITDVDKYEGDYIITPLAYESQILETKQKLCTENIVVKEVPKWETSNQSGGYTVYIANGGV